MTIASPAISAARHRLGQAIRSGKVVRPNRCQRCGEPDIPLRDGRTSIQGHHHLGYDKPLDVEWLCVRCHRRETTTNYGEKAHVAKATWALVDIIRGRYATGESYYKIADELGFNRTTVHRIVTHRSWPEHSRPSTATSISEAS